MWKRLQSPDIAEDVVYMVEGEDVRNMQAEELQDLEKRLKNDYRAI